MSLYTDLKIVPISDILLQEFTESERVLKLEKLIEKERMLKNPIIVVRYGDRYLHLDGATRTTALKALGCKYILVQVVDYKNQDQVKVMSWSHLTQIDADQFFDELAKFPAITIRKKINYAALHGHNGVLCQLITREGGEYTIEHKGDAIAKIDFLQYLFELYDHRFDRLFISDKRALKTQNVFSEYLDKNLLVLFRDFTPDEIISAIKKKRTLPAGITRHIIKDRKLNVCVPLEILRSSSQSSAQQKLESLLEKKSMRYYEEPVVYFE